MFSKKCPACRKDIPQGITECPYCRSDEQGRPSPEAQLISASLETEVESALVQMESDDPFVRNSAADRLYQKGAMIIPLLIKVLEGPTRKALPEVAKLLGRFRDPRATSALSQAMKAGDETMKTSAVWALSQVNDPKAIDELLAEAERHNPVIQGFLAHTLVSYQDPRVTSSLMKLARHSSREVSFQAIWSLGEIGDTAAIPFLRRLLGKKDALIKAAAKTSLKRLGGPLRRLLPWWSWLAGAAGVAGLAGVWWAVYK